MIKAAALDNLMAGVEGFALALLLGLALILVVSATVPRF